LNNLLIKQGTTKNKSAETGWSKMFQKRETNKGNKS